MKKLLILSVLLSVGVQSVFGMDRDFVGDDHVTATNCFENAKTECAKLRKTTENQDGTDPSQPPTDSRARTSPSPQEGQHSSEKFEKSPLADVSDRDFKDMKFDWNRLLVLGRFDSLDYALRIAMQDTSVKEGGTKSKREVALDWVSDRLKKLLKPEEVLYIKPDIGDPNNPLWKGEISADGCILVETASEDEQKKWLRRFKIEVGEQELIFLLNDLSRSADMKEEKLTRSLVSGFKKCFETDDRSFLTFKFFHCRLSSIKKRLLERRGSSNDLLLLVEKHLNPAFGFRTKEIFSRLIPTSE